MAYNIRNIKKKFLWFFCNRKVHNYTRFNISFSDGLVGSWKTSRSLRICMQDTVFIVQTSAVRKVAVVQLAVQKSIPLGKIDKTKTDNTTCSLFASETFIFNVTPTITHRFFLVFVTDSHSSQKRDPGFIREMPPKGSLSRALYFAAGDTIECRMVSKAPQYVAPDRRHYHYRYCRKMCYFVLSCLVDQCHWGNITAWLMGSCPILYAGTS